jgi:hypothetical protein
VPCYKLSLTTHRNRQLTNAKLGHAQLPHKSNGKSSQTFESREITGRRPHGLIAS